jgi:hypothetical protein
MNQREGDEAVAAAREGNIGEALVIVHKSGKARVGLHCGVEGLRLETRKVLNKHIYGQLEGRSLTERPD